MSEASRNVGPRSNKKEEKNIMAEKEKTNVTGLESASNRKEAEYDLVKSLLEAAEFKTSEDFVTEVEMKRAGKFMFAVHIHPVSDPDTRLARKKATIYMKNPNGKGLPPIEKDFDTSKFRSWLIYLATTEEDQQKIWGNPALMQKHNLAEPWESIDTVLSFGEKSALFDEVTKISGLDEDGNPDEEYNMDDEEYAKN